MTRNKKQVTQQVKKSKTNVQKNEKVKEFLTSEMIDNHEKIQYKFRYLDALADIYRIKGKHTETCAAIINYKDKFYLSYNDDISENLNPGVINQVKNISNFINSNNQVALISTYLMNNQEIITRLLKHLEEKVSCIYSGDIISTTPLRHSSSNIPQKAANNNPKQQNDQIKARIDQYLNDFEQKLQTEIKKASCFGQSDQRYEDSEVAQKIIHHTVEDTQNIITEIIKEYKESFKDKYSKVNKKISSNKNLLISTSTHENSIQEQIQIIKEFKNNLSRAQTAFDKFYNKNSDQILVTQHNDSLKKKNAINTEINTEISNFLTKLEKDENLDKQIIAEYQNSVLTKLESDGKKNVQLEKTYYDTIYNDYLNVLGILSNTKNTISESIKEFLIRPLQDVEKVLYQLQGNQIEVIILPNEQNIHAEFNIAQKFPRADDNYIGVSKLCCGFCDNALGNIYQYKHRGTHGTAEEKWYKNKIIFIQDFEEFKESTNIAGQQLKNKIREELSSKQPNESEQKLTPEREVVEEITKRHTNQFQNQHRRLSCDDLEKNITILALPNSPTLWQIKEQLGLLTPEYNSESIVDPNFSETDMYAVD